MCKVSSTKRNWCCSWSFLKTKKLHQRLCGWALLIYYQKSWTCSTVQYGFLAEEYNKGLNDLQVMCLIKLHCSMQICLLPKSKMWVEADDHHSISRLSQEPIPQVFVPKIEVKNTHTHIHTKTVSCKDMDSTDDAAFCICEVLKAQASKYMAIWQLEKKRKNYEVDLMSLKNLGLNLLAVGGVFDLLQASEFWSHTTKSPNGWIKFPYSPSSSLN